MIKNVTIGADPEFFLYSIARKQYVSAEGIIGGKKEKPVTIPTGEMILEDGVAVEFCTTVCKNAKQLNKSISNALTHLRGIVPSYLDFKFQAYAEFEYDQLNTEQASILGCQPDSDAYTLKQNPQPTADVNFRVAAGHVHIGYKEPNFEDSINLVKLFDLYLAVPSILMDEDRQRRQMYGKAGAHRIKPYGVEARVLSNFWVNKPELVDWVVNTIFKMIDDYNGKPNIIQTVNWDLVQTCINEYDTFLAEELISKHKLELPTSVKWELEKINNKITISS